MGFIVITGIGMLLLGMMGSSLGFWGWGDGKSKR
jgi:hypothetical protein